MKKWLRRFLLNLLKEDEPPVKELPKEPEVRKTTPLREFVVGDHIEMSDEYLEYAPWKLSPETCKARGIDYFSQCTKQGKYRSGIIKMIEPRDGWWLVYYDCVQTGRVEMISEYWLQKFTGVKYVGNKKVAAETIEDVLKKKGEGV